MRIGSPDFTASLPIAEGGTGATNEADARTSLGAQRDLTAIATPQSFNDQPIHRYGAAVEEVTGTTYPFTAADNGKIKYFTNTGAIAASLPAGLPAGFNCSVIQWQTGQATLSAGSGAAVFNRQNQFKTAGRYAIVSIIMIAPDSFLIFGDTAA